VDGDLRGGDGDPRIFGNSLCDGFVAVTLPAKRLDLIADHADESLDGKHLRTEARQGAKSFLGADGFLDGVKRGFLRIVHRNLS